MGVKCENDKFYTNTKVIDNLINKINFNKYDLIVEPSAGDGAFSNKIKLKTNNELLSFDIKPENKDIIEQDWFNYKINQKYNKVLVIGNPPFGINNKLSLNFIKHALSFDNVITIAFILPNVYNKHTKQKVFPKNWKLVRVEKLPYNSFLLNNEEYHVPCTFYIWTKEESIIDYRFDYKKYETNPDFIIIKNKEDFNKADFFIMGASPSNIKNISEVTKNNRGYYIKSNIDTEELKFNLKNINWRKEGNSSASGGVSWFSIPELNYIYDLNKLI